MNNIKLKWIQLSHGLHQKCYCGRGDFFHHNLIYVNLHNFSQFLHNLWTTPKEKKISKIYFHQLPIPLSITKHHFSSTQKRWRPKSYYAFMSLKTLIQSSQFLESLKMNFKPVYQKVGCFSNKKWFGKLYHNYTFLGHDWWCPEGSVFSISWPFSEVIWHFLFIKISSFVELCEEKFLDIFRPWHNLWISRYYNLWVWKTFFRSISKFKWSFHKSIKLLINQMFHFVTEQIWWKNLQLPSTTPNNISKGFNRFPYAEAEGSSSLQTSIKFKFSYPKSQYSASFEYQHIYSWFTIREKEKWKLYWKTRCSTIEKFYVFSSWHRFPNSFLLDLVSSIERADWIRLWKIC